MKSKVKRAFDCSGEKFEIWKFNFVAVFEPSEGMNVMAGRGEYVVTALLRIMGEPRLRSIGLEVVAAFRQSVSR